MKIFLLLFLLLYSIENSYCQTEVLSETEKNETIISLCKALEQNYFDTVLCKGLIIELKENMEKGVFDKIKLPIEFETKLDSIIRGYTKDNHFKVIYDEKWISENEIPKTPRQYQELLEIEKQESQKINFGFHEVKILGGNIGYIRFSSFENPEFAAATLANAMNFITNTDAVIIDLRNNVGGYMDMAALLCSYFISTNTDFYIPLTEMNIRKNGKDILIQHNAFGSVGAPKMINQSLYILTNHRSFSAAEWTAFLLKNRKRAIIVGEKTTGGTHPTDQIPISKKFSINIPMGTMVDAITKTHFEGVGVIPDINVHANDALIYAQIDILEKASENSENKQYFEWHLLQLRASLNPVVVSPKLLAAYTGKYGNIELKVLEEKLCSVREGIVTELIPLTENVFALKGRDDLRIKIVLEDKKAIAIERLFYDGTSLKTERQ